MRLTKSAGRRIGTVAAALAVLAGTAAAGSAQADSTAQGGTITLRSDIGPVPYFLDWSTGTLVGHLPAGDSLIANCWMEGQFVSDHGVAHDRWVQFNSSGGTYYFWGGVLKGDETGGITNHC